MVSIIIPTYNSEHVICRAVDSCLDQTYRDIEIIVIDDGSTDDTQKVLEKYAHETRFKYIYQNNQERSYARNNALKLANGEFIQFLDADDIIHPQKLEKQVAYLTKNPEYYMVYCGVEYKNNANEVVGILEKKNIGNIERMLLKSNFLAINSPLIRKNEVRFSVDLNRLEDWEYWIYATKNKLVGYIDEMLCSVYVDHQITMQYIIHMQKSEIKVYNKLLKNNDFKEYKNLLHLQKLKRFISIMKNMLIK